MKKLFILFLVASTTISFAQETALLRLNYKKGDKYTMNMKQSMNTAAMANNTDIDMVLEVTDVADNMFTTVTKFAKMKMDMMQGGMQMSYDSSKKDEELDQMGLMLKQQISPMLKTVITTKNDVYGKNVDVQVTPEGPMSEQFKNSSSVTYPEKAVKVGDTWKNETENQGVKSIVEYKVKEITATKVVLDFSGTLSGVATGTSSGMVEVDRESGALLKSVLKNVLKAGGQDMKMDMEITMTKM